jgi:N-acetylglucosamine-6-phosphate deacetylase
MPDGEYAFGGRPVVKAGGAVRLGDGTLAGSALRLDQAVRNVVALGVPLAEAVAAASTRPARLVGRPDLGRLVPRAPADVVVLDDALEVQRVLVDGFEPET